MVRIRSAMVVAPYKPRRAGHSGLLDLDLNLHPVDNGDERSWYPTS